MPILWNVQVWMAWFESKRTKLCRNGIPGVAGRGSGESGSAERDPPASAA